MVYLSSIRKVCIKHMLRLLLKIVENMFFPPQRISLPTCIFDRNIRGKTSKVKWLFESNFARSERVSVPFEQ